AGRGSFTRDSQAGGMAACGAGAGGGKSGLQGNRVPANGRGGRPQGKCQRKQTAVTCARESAGAARVKGCGKSAPRYRQRQRQGKPHREQTQIGTAGGANARAGFSAVPPAGPRTAPGTD